MAITSKTTNGKILYSIYLNIRSKINPTIRIQKREGGFDSRAKAQRRENELREICVREMMQQEGILPSWGEIVKRWESFKRNVGDVQEDTINDYVHALTLWTRNIWDKPCNEIHKGEIREIIENLKEEKLSNSFQLKVLNTIKRVYSWGKEEGMIRGGLDNITSGIKISRQEEKTPEILSLDQISILLEQAKKEKSSWYALWTMAVMTGCRNGELFALEWSEVDFDNNKITISKSFNKRLNKTKSTKSGYFRTIPMNDALKELLLELRANAKENHVLPRMALWDSGLQARELRKFCQKVNIPSVKFHALRACFATHLLSNGVAIGQVQKICGWADLETMMRYIRLAGVDVKGATTCLNILSPNQSDEKVLNIMDFKSEKQSLATSGYLAQREEYKISQL